MKRTFVASLVGLLMTATSANAGGAKEAADAFGLIGAWAKVDCGQPASPENVREFWGVDANGGLTEAITIGTGYVNYYRFDQGERIADDKLAFDAVFLATGDRMRLVLEKRDGKIRTFSSRDITTERDLVSDGIILGNGQPTAWLAKCPA